MKRIATLPLLAGFALLIASGHAARADESVRQVWHDSEDQVVHNTWGSCVRSRWDLNSDPCAPPVIAYQPPPPPPPPRTVIAEADRTVYFPFNAANLTPESQQRLDSLAQRINSASDIQDAQVVGFADRIGTTSYNEALSKKRAESVRNYLVGRNVVTENDTVTRWVGKTESNTQCPPHSTREQLIQCLAPDRKVTVELKYKVQEQPAPQVNAAPPGQLVPGQPVMGQPPLAPTATAHVYQSNAVVPPAPFPTEKNNNNSSYQTYPLPQQPGYDPNASVQTYPIEQQQSSAAPDPALTPVPAPDMQSSVAPAPLPPSDMQSSAVPPPADMQPAPLPPPVPPSDIQSSTAPAPDMQPMSLSPPANVQSSAMPSPSDMRSAPPEAQPNSSSPAAYTIPGQTSSVETYPTAVDQVAAAGDSAQGSQPSDQDRWRNLTTGE